MDDLKELEQRLAKLHDQCGRQSGLPAYPALDQQRKDVIRQIEAQRVLTRWEYINLYEYKGWLELCEQLGLPEDHPVAESRKKVLRNDLDVEIERWDDPGDYPSGAGSGPLPSYDYVGEISGEVHVQVEGKPPLKDGCENSDIEEYDPDLLELLDDAVPSGVTVQKWGVTLNGQVIEFHVQDFEACDWEPPEPPEDW